MPMSIGGALLLVEKAVMRLSEMRSTWLRLF
jgi:hypothetical protein